MASLVCDLCGGKLIMGAGGIATCAKCGMEYSADRLREKILNIDISVPTDNSHIIQNYIHIAQNAYKSNNYIETENYCNKIIEMSPFHPHAWLLKGCASGWQSSLKSIRILEAINCFINAITYAEEPERSSTINQCQQEVEKLANAILLLRGEHFAKYPDETEKNNFMNDISIVSSTVSVFSDNIQDTTIRQKIFSSLANIISEAVMNAWKYNIRPTFANDHDGHPDDYELNKLIINSSHCLVLLNKSIELTENDYEENISRYENLVDILTYLVNAKSYSYQTVHIRDSWLDGSAIYENQYVESNSIPYSLASEYKNLIFSYRKKIQSFTENVASRKHAENTHNKEVFWNRFPHEQTILTDALDLLRQKREQFANINALFHQIQFIDMNIAEIFNILNKDRDISDNLTQEEEAVLLKIPDLLEKVKKIESEHLTWRHNAETIRMSARPIATRNYVIASIILIILDTLVICTATAFSNISQTHIEIIAITTIATGLVICISILALKSIRNSTIQYNNAITMVKKGHPSEAISAFSTLPGYAAIITQIEEFSINFYGEECWKKIKSVKIGDTLNFGSYKQDNSKSNSKKALEWLVVSREHTRILVVSVDSVDSRAYHTHDEAASWETCSLRKWLNSDFMNSAFSYKEKAMIPKVKIPNHENPMPSIDSDNPTEDQVFLFSTVEASEYLTCSTIDSWLRSPGNWEHTASYLINGHIQECSLFVNSDYPVHPVLWIDLNS